MPRPTIHTAKAVLPDGTPIETRTIGCKPYVVIAQYTVDGKIGPWVVVEWCSMMEIAHSKADTLRRQFSNWAHKQVCVRVETTSCHVATGRDKEWE